ncbi:MAG: hypothetical protein IKD73_07915 [Selenomonadaceae bacterium]|nr:hypothetical protein [Selenomonadaceae bacterium]
MVKLYDEDMTGYIEVEVKDFYCNDYPNHFARTGKQTYVRWLGEQIYTVPQMVKGSQPTDSGNLIIEAADYDDFIAREPKAKKWIRPYVGSREFIHRLPRYCLWLVDCPPNELRRMPLVYQRVQAVRDFRLASKKAATRRDAATPWLFQERRQPTTNYLLVPSVSSERREYVPIGWMDANTIASNLVLMVPGAMYWHFGVLTSYPHMAWMRATCGRLTSRYRYSADVVYNNFPWPPFNREVELTAAEILFARSKYPDASFADLYDPLIMPKDLRKAHEANDKAVLEAYDLPLNITEEQLQKELFKMYKSLRDFDEFYQSL